MKIFKLWIDNSSVPIRMEAESLDEAKEIALANFPDCVYTIEESR